MQGAPFQIWAGTLLDIVRVLVKLKEIQTFQALNSALRSILGCEMASLKIALESAARRGHTKQKHYGATCQTQNPVRKKLESLFSPSPLIVC